MIIAVVGKGRRSAAIGADRQGTDTDNNESFNLPGPKLVQYDEWAWGGSGHLYVFDDLRYNLERRLGRYARGPLACSLSADDWVHLRFMPVYRELMGEYERSRLDMVLLVKDHAGYSAYVVGRDRGICYAESRGEFAAVGSGKLAARGAAYAISAESPLASPAHVCSRAVQAANHTMVTCGGGFPTIIEFKDGE